MVVPTSQFSRRETSSNAKDSDADLDAVVACPRAVTRAHFFGGLARALRAHARVARLVTVEEGLVPLMAFAFDGVDVDRTFASVPRDRRARPRPQVHRPCDSALKLLR